MNTRLFLAAEIAAAWPSEFRKRKGRFVPEETRHITLEFFGTVSLLPLLELVTSMPPFPFLIGPVGKADSVLFLPPQNPRVVSYHVTWLEGEKELLDFHTTLQLWLREKGYNLEQRTLLSHVTVARAPFDKNQWESVTPFPLFIRALHLYDSRGNLTYVPVWSHRLLPPFEELDHIADIAFLIRAKTLEQLYLHAAWALCFKFPALQNYVTTSPIFSLDDIVMHLNQIIAQADQEIGCPFKAVSFHGTLVYAPNQILEWEMIVDV